MNTVEVDPKSTNYRPEGSENSIEDSKAHSFSLLSPARSLKFDLLLHLITNLAKPIVLCGPNGIGKTTFLQQISVQGPKAWTVCYFESTPQTTFESILQRLDEFAASDSESASVNGNEQSPSDQIKRMKENGRTLVLLLDNAGLLMPGLLQVLCQFAQSRPGIRLVFSMRPDHLHVKTATDLGLDECHIVDLPPLTEQQCLEFLQEFPAKTPEDVSVKAITPALVQRAYRESHGIPGEIIKFLPEDSKIDRAVEHVKFYHLSICVVSVITIAATSIFLKSYFKDEPMPESSSIDGSQREQMLNRLRPPTVISDTKGARSAKEQFTKAQGVNVEVKGPETERPENGYGEPNAETKLVTADKSRPVLTEKKIGAGGFPRQTNPKGTDDLHEQPNDQDKFNQDPVATDGRLQNPAQISDRNPPVASKPVSTVAKSRELGDRNPTIEAVNLAKSQQENTPEQNHSSLIDFMIPGIQGSAWLLAQNPNHWTLQLIVVNRLNLLRSFAADHSDLGMLASFGLKLEDKTVFRVFYGTFPTLKKAKLANGDLPASLRQSWPRRFKLIHEEIGATQSSGNGL